MRILVQLAFNSHDDVARQEFVDTGVWMTLRNGRIGLTQNYRPYKAAKFIRSDDSFFQVARVNELYVYRETSTRGSGGRAWCRDPLEPRDLETIRGFGHGDYAAVVRDVKGHLKGPLSDKQPIYALNFRRLGRIGETLVAEDAKGERLVLTDTGMAEEPPSCHLLSLMPKESFEGQTLIARFPPRPRHAQATDQAVEHRDAGGDHPVDVVVARGALSDCLRSSPPRPGTPGRGVGAEGFGTL